MRERRLLTGVGYHWRALSVVETAAAALRDAPVHLLTATWLDSTPAPLVIEIGAGRAVPTVRNFTRRMQLRGSALVRINLYEANIHNPKDIELALRAKDALEQIASHLQPSLWQC